jgi:hypothetical protein
MCLNKGTNGLTINWQCSTQGMPVNLNFGKMMVQCKGYDSSTDPYVLIGSCALKYEIIAVQSPPAPTFVPPPASTSNEYTIAVIFTIVIIIILLLCLFYYTRTSQSEYVQVSGKDDLNYDRPPPYAPTTTESLPPQTVTKSPPPQTVTRSAPPMPATRPPARQPRIRTPATTYVYTESTPYRTDLYSSYMPYTSTTTIYDLPVYSHHNDYATSDYGTTSTDSSTKEGIGYATTENI